MRRWGTPQLRWDARPFHRAAVLLKPPEGFDPPTCCLRNSRSTGLSYGGADRKEMVLRHKDSEAPWHTAANV